MSDRSQFERAIRRNAWRDSAARPTWRWRARRNYLFRRLERCTSLTVIIIGLAAGVFYLSTFAAMFLGFGFRHKNILRGSNGQLLPLAFFAVAALGAAASFGYQWRGMLGKLKSLSLQATLPFSNRKLLNIQRRIAWGMSAAPVIVTVFIVCTLALQEKLSVAGWSAVIAIIIAQACVVYYTIFLVSLRLERPRNNSAIRAGLIMMVIMPFLLAAGGSYQANHASGLSRFTFTFLPTGWTLGAFYHGVLHGDWRGAFYLLPVIAFLWYTRRLVRNDLKLYEFTFNQPGATSTSWFRPEEREAQSQLPNLACGVKSHAHERMSQQPWLANELHDAMLGSIEQASDGTRFQVWYSRLRLRNRPVLELVCGSIPTGISIWALTVGAVLCLLLDSVVPMSDKSFALQRSFFLTLAVVWGRIVRPQDKETTGNSPGNLKAFSRLPFAWSRLMHGLGTANFMVFIPVLLIAIALAVFYCIRHAVPLSYAVPGYVAFPYVLLFAAPAWIVPSVLVLRQWQGLLVGIVICVLPWGESHSVLLAVATHGSATIVVYTCRDCAADRRLDLAAHDSLPLPPRLDRHWIMWSTGVWLARSPKDSVVDAEFGLSVSDF